MFLPASYHSGFAPRDGRPLYPSLWNGCIGAWAPCLGPTGLVVRDSSRVRNHAVLTNMDASDWVISDGRYALDFDGLDDYLEISAPFAASTLLYTFSGWFYFRALSGNDSDPTIFNSGSSAYFAIGSSNRMQFFSGAWRSFTGTIPTAQWVHLALVRRSVSSCEGYINGVSAGVLAFNPGDLISTSYIGSRKDAAALGLDGMADSVALHNRPLHSSEIALLASRRGVAYELMSRRRGDNQVVVNRRRRLLVGAGH